VTVEDINLTVVFDSFAALLQDFEAEVRTAVLVDNENTPLQVHACING